MEVPSLLLKAATPPDDVLQLAADATLSVKASASTPSHGLWTILWHYVGSARQLKALKSWGGVPMLPAFAAQACLSRLP